MFNHPGGTYLKDCTWSAPYSHVMAFTTEPFDYHGALVVVETDTGEIVLRAR